MDGQRQRPVDGHGQKAIGLWETGQLRVCGGHEPQASIKVGTSNRCYIIGYDVFFGLNRKTSDKRQTAVAWQCLEWLLALSSLQ